MGGPYNIPRNYKGEGRILFIFSTKAFIYTLISGLIGVPFWFVFRMFNHSLVGLIFIVFFALIGFIIGTFKIPDNQRFEFNRNVGGEAIDDIIVRWIKFKKNGKKIYVYKEETKDVK